MARSQVGSNWRVSAIDFEIFDERFKACIRTSAKIEQLHSGCRWTEGPVYIPAMRCLIFSDIPNDRMLKFDEESEAVSIFRKPAGYTNGNTLDRQGRLVSCQHGMRRVIRTEHDGSTTVLADRFEGKRFNSPNDVVVKSDESIWFTDPSYGIDSDYEGHAAPSELGARCVYRVDAHSGHIAMVADGFAQPNGLAFSTDEKRLYVIDSGQGHGLMRVFDVTDEGSLQDSTLRDAATFATYKTGMFDGLRIDTENRIWTSAGEGVLCYESDGTLLGRIAIPERVSNLTFGGPKRNRLFITATSSLYSVMLPVNGAKTL
jgi:gluconolactonase